MPLTNEQILRWFGPPAAALRAHHEIPADVPESLHDDWRLLKRHGYTDAEARAAIAPSLARLAK